MTKNMRRGFFLATTARIGLHGHVIKDADGHSDPSVEVGPGFEDAATRLSGDDTRPESMVGKGATQEIPDDDGGDQGGEDEGGNPPPEDAEAKREKAEKTDKRAANRFIRELKAENAEMRARLEAVEKGTNRPSTGGGGDAKPAETKDVAAPDPNDAEKYPLGVIDDGYHKDLAKWTARQEFRELRAAEIASEKATREQQTAQSEAADMRGKLNSLVETGADLFEDFEDKVLEPALKGDLKVSKPTFVRAAKEPHGAEILYELAKDLKEAERVSLLPDDEQIAYVIEKNREIAAKRPAPRTKTKAGDPPANAPRGRNSSAPIRGDTNNLRDFKKLYYSQQ